MLMPHLLFAADWTLTPTLSLSETYSDNITLSADNIPAESQWVSQINPGMAVIGKGRESEFSLLYRMQNLFYAGENDRNSTNHQLNANAKAALVSRVLFLDVLTSVSQQIINPDEKITTNNLAIVGGRQDVITTKISPYIDTRFSDYFHANIRTTQQRLIYKQDNLPDSTSNLVSMKLGSEPNVMRWSWELRASSENITYGDVPSAVKPGNEKRKDASLNLGFQVSSKFRLTAGGGYEDHEYPLSQLVEQPNSNYWQAGVVWTPDQRTTLTVGGGERFFGKTKSLLLKYKGRRNELQLSFNEDLSSLRETLQQVGTGYIKIYDDYYYYEDGYAVRVPDADVPYVKALLGDKDNNISFNEISLNEVFINRAAKFTWIFKSKKSATTFTVNRSRREYQNSQIEENFFQAGLGWNVNLTRHTDFSANLNYQNTRRLVGDDVFKTASIRYGRKMGQHVSSAVELLHNRRDTEITTDLNDYSENQVTANLDVKW